jgi:DNA replication protein DnaC
MKVADIDPGLYERRGLMKRYQGREVIPHRSYGDALDKVQQWMNDYAAGTHNGEGLLLYGPPGTGKTLLGHVIVTFSLSIKKLAWFAEVDTYLDWVKWSYELSTQSQTNRDFDWDLYRQLHKVLSGYKNDELLVLDDPKPNQSDWARQQLNSLVRYRGNRMLTTVITTNFVNGDWTKYYGDSMSSYLHEVCRFVAVASPDSRLAH